MTQTTDIASDEVTASLAGAAFHALKWRYAGAILQSGLQFAVGITLARLLSPEAFGLVAMALIASGLGRLVADLGFGTAIIQYTGLTQAHVRAAFTGSAVAGVLLFFTLWFFAPAISRLFGQDELVPMLRVIGILLFGSGMSVIAVSLLRRQLRFRLLTVIEGISYMVGFGGFGVPMAVLGYGAWSLIAANIVQPLCLFVLSIYFIKPPLQPYFGFRAYRDLLRVASAEMLNNLVNFAAENLHFFVLGKWLGASPLGLFNRSFNLMHLPVKHFSFALWSVTFPFYAKIQGDIPRLGRAFLHTVSLTALVTVPVFFAMAAAPEIVIGGLFGEQWKPAATTFRILSISGPFMAMMRVFAAVSYARGYVFSESARQAIYLGLVTLAVWLLFPFGLEGIALAVALATLARYFLLAHLSLQLAGVKWRQFLVAQLPGLFLGIAVAAPVYFVSVVGTLFITSDIMMLLLIVVLTVVSLSFSFLLFPSSWFGDVYPWLFSRFGPRLPHWLYELVMAKLLASSYGRIGKKLEAKI